MILTIERFGGMRPRFAPEVLDPDDAERASAIILGSGVLDPEVVPTAVGTVSKAGTPITFYVHKDRFLHWTTDVNVARYPSAGNTDDRIAYTGDGVPKFTDYTLAGTGAGTDYPLTSYNLGIPKPATAATLTIAGGAAPTETRSYVYTFVDNWGRESQPSDPLTATGNISGTWNFNGMATASPAGTFIANKRIYRTVTSNTGAATYLFVAQIALATANYGDVIAAAALGEELPSVGWAEPDSGMHSLVEMPGGILAGLSGNEICFCEPFQAHAWPAKYRIAVGHTPVGLGVFNANLVVATKGTPYIVTGSHPDTMGITQVDAQEPCISKRSIVGMGFGVGYASPNGIVIVSTVGTKLVTEDIFTREQWQAIIGYTTQLVVSPVTITAARYRGKYAFFSSGGQIFQRLGIVERDAKGSYSRGAFFPGTPILKGLYTNVEQEDQLYVLGSDKVVYSYGWTVSGINSLDMQPDAASLNYHEGQWRSKRFKVATPTAFQFLRVEADLSNAHQEYLDRPLDEETNMALVGMADKSPVGGHALSEVALGEGSSRPIFAPGLLSNASTLKYQQGYVKVTILADNGQGRNAKSKDTMATIDTVYVPGGYPIPIKVSGKYDTWQVEVAATCRVKRVQLSTTAAELRGV